MTAFGLYDNVYQGSDRNPFSWYAVGIPVRDSLAESTHELEDLQWNFPWYLASVRLYLNIYSNFKVEKCKDNLLSKIVENERVQKVEKTVEKAFPVLKEYSALLKKELFSRKSSSLKQNDWFSLGQPQYTVDALSIVEKSIKKFNLLH